MVPSASKSVCWLKKDSNMMSVEPTSTTICCCFSLLVLPLAKCHMCLIEEITVGQEMCGSVTVMVTLDKSVSSEWEHRFR